MASSPIDVGAGYAAESIAACAAGGFTATLGSGTSGDTRVGGVSDLTSQEGKDKSIGQRAKEGVQGLTGLQLQHCLLQARSVACHSCARLAPLPCKVVKSAW